MSAVTALNTCVCGSIGAPNVVRFAECHHRYFRGDKQLASVSSVLRSIVPTDLSSIDPTVLENARDRGVAVDSLFSAYVLGKLNRIPAGTRLDAVNLFQKLRSWWIPHEEVRSQVVLANDDVAGTCDLIIDGGIWDLKATYNLAPAYALQVGLYGVLYENMYGHVPNSLGLIQVTARHDKPIVVSLDVDATLADARTLLECWRMVQRRMPGK